MVSGFGQVSGPEAFSTGHFIKKVTCERKSGQREKPLDQSAIPLRRADYKPQPRLYQNIQKVDVLLIGSLEMSNVSNALIGLQSEWARDRDAGGLKVTKIRPKQSKHTLCTYQCKPRGGGGGAGKGWGFDKFQNFSIKFPRVGNERSIKSVKKAPTPGGKI